MATGPAVLGGSNPPYPNDKVNQLAFVMKLQIK
jgi:hypothetical protein